MTTIAKSSLVGGGFTLSDIQRHIGTDVDGQIGPKTLAAIASALGMKPTVLKTFALNDPAAFFKSIKPITGSLDQTQVDSINAIMEACKHWPAAWVAYALATAWHESRFRPIGEMGGNVYLHEMYDIQGKRRAKALELGNTTPGDGVKYAGRGFVQLTGKNNYRKAGEFLGFTLENQPEMALNITFASRILVWGMETGAFTGKSLSDFLPPVATTAQFIKARAIINGTDKALAIADYAADFQQALWMGVYA